MSEEGVIELLNMLNATYAFPKLSHRTLAEDVQSALTNDWKTTDDIAAEIECPRSSVAVALGRLVDADVSESALMQGEIIWRGQFVRRKRVFFRLKSAEAVT